MDPKHDPVVQMVGCQDRLLAYVSGMVPDFAVAEDIIQDLAIEISAHRERYSPDRPFYPWARGIARNLVKRHYAAQSRARVITVEDLDVLADAMEEKELEEDQWRDRARAMRSCLEELSPANRKLMTSRYASNRKGRSLESEFRKTGNALRVSLFRIRSFLRSCIERHLAVEGVS